MKETNHKLGVWCLSALIGLIGLITIRTVTGHFIVDFMDATTVTNVMIGVLVVAIVILLIYSFRDNLKGLIMQVVGTFAILAGLFVLFKYVHDIELVSALISLTFGVWAIIWTLNTRSVLSKGSSMRKYATSFFFCLIFVMAASIWDTAVNLLGLEGSWKNIRYIILIFVYTTFVLASFRVYKMGKEFGFSKQSDLIKAAMRKNKKKKV